MRLADQVLQHAAACDGHPLKPDWTAFADRLRAAAHYGVDASVGHLSYGVTEASPYRAATRTRGAVAFPGEVCWFEWAGPSVGMGPRAGDAARPGSIVPDRCGVLVQTRPGDRRVGMMSWVWSLPGLGLEICPFAITFDWRPVAEPVPDVVRASFELVGRSWTDHVRGIHDKSRFTGHAFADMEAEERRYGHLPNPMLTTFWTMMALLQSTDPAQVERAVRGALRDVEHEPIFVLGLMIALCTEGLVNVGEPDDYERLNVARRKRRQPPLLPFRTLTASGKNVIRLSDRGGALETMPAFHAA